MGTLATGNEIHSTAFPDSVPDRTKAASPNVDWQPHLLPWGLLLGTQPHHPRLSVSNQRHGKKQDFLLSMGAAGHSWEFGTASCSCWGQEAKECVCFSGFPGTQLSCHCSHWALSGPTLGLTVGTFYPIMKGIWNR